ncbi:MAG: DEAD/DEAH box helicase, partial [Candidatus Mariimomonas ferrooxydans]
MKFEELKIHEKVLEGIRTAGFTECTPVQALTLPVALLGKDIAAQAQTGTGKTAAYLITIFSRMLSVRPPGPGPSPHALHTTSTITHPRDSTLPQPSLSQGLHTTSTITHP